MCEITGKGFIILFIYFKWEGGREVIHYRGKDLSSIRAKHELKMSMKQTPRLLMWITEAVKLPDCSEHISLGGSMMTRCADVREHIFQDALLYEPRDKLVGGPLGPVLRVNHEEHVGEAGAEIGSIRVVVSGGLWCVDIHTFGTVELHHGLSGDVRQTCRGREPETGLHGWNECTTNTALI